MTIKYAVEELKQIIYEGESTQLVRLAAQLLELMERPQVKVIDRKDVRASVQESFNSLKLMICESDEVIDLSEDVLRVAAECADQEEEEAITDIAPSTCERDLYKLLSDARDEGYTYVILS